MPPRQEEEAGSVERLVLPAAAMALLLSVRHTSSTATGRDVSPLPTPEDRPAHQQGTDGRHADSHGRQQQAEDIRQWTDGVVDRQTGNQASDEVGTSLPLVTKDGSDRARSYTHLRAGRGLGLSGLSHKGSTRDVADVS